MRIDSPQLAVYIDKDIKTELATEAQNLGISQAAYGRLLLKIGRAVVKENPGVLGNMI